MTRWAARFDLAHEAMRTRQAAGEEDGEAGSNKSHWTSPGSWLRTGVPFFSFD